jgi:diaminopimelate epimerase
MHGLGNDFVLIDCRKSEPGIRDLELSTLAVRLCNRRFGIGADQMLTLHDSGSADFRMRIFNADGSEVEMCGNGIRCLAKYIWDRKLSDKNVLSIETLAGVMKPEKSGDMVTVDMGEPAFDPKSIPVRHDKTVEDLPLLIEDQRFAVTCLSMGNPHVVIVVDNVAQFEVKKYGPLIENHEMFPNRINVEFVQVINQDTVKMRVWERGAGETMACGTGASAVAVALNRKGLTAKKIKVLLLGGELMVEWKRDNHVYMTGPAVEVFGGSIHL